MTTDHAKSTDQQQDDHREHDEETRTNASKSKTHTHASRSCGARREPWRARSELLRRARHKINVSEREDQ